jgi:D-alanyl-D-alanine carboxypeptidase
MAWVTSGAHHGLRFSLLGLSAAVAALTINSDSADARHHRRLHVHYVHVGHVHHHATGGGYSPPYSSIMVDGNNGQVLESANPDALRHPASLTKVMTLYLLFERLDAGKIRLDAPLKISQHASEQSPTKLELKPGQTITVEDAIRGIVTKSANDAAVVVAENLGGDESTFAKLMTQKAHALGMARTTYVNASGLPDDDQLTTARDQALLGRAIQDRFPRFYRYFQTESFVYHGEAMRNHNHLLGSVPGVDGIKTGFTRASGFNLLTSVHRDGRYIVGVVMGGPSASERDARMRELISDHIREAALRRTAPVIADAAEPREETQPVAFAKTSLAARAEAASPPAVHADAHAAAGSSDPIRPVLVKTISYRTAPVRTAALAPMPALIAVGSPAAPQALPQPSAPTLSPVAAYPQVRAEVASADPVAEVRDAPPEHEAATSARADAAVSLPAASAHMHGGWLIQIGAFDDEDQAKQHLSSARTKVHAALAAADPFTERVQKGDKALYRARFAGFDKATAESACRELKRSDFACMALKD